MVASAASDFFIEAGALVGGGMALGGTAGFVGWMLAAPVLRVLGRRKPEEERFERDRLGVFLAVGGGVGGIAGFLVWFYEHQGVI